LIGDKILTALKQQGLKPADLSKMTGLSTGLISEILSGKRQDVTFTTIKRIASALNVSVVYFTDSNSNEILNFMSDTGKAFVLDESNKDLIELLAWAKSKGLTKNQLRHLLLAIIEK